MGSTVGAAITCLFLLAVLAAVVYGAFLSPHRSPQPAPPQRDPERGHRQVSDGCDLSTQTAPPPLASERGCSPACLDDDATFDCFAGVLRRAKDRAIDHAAVLCQDAVGGGVERQTEVEDALLLLSRSFLWEVILGSGRDRLKEFFVAQWVDELRERGYDPHGATAAVTEGMASLGELVEDGPDAAASATRTYILKRLVKVGFILRYDARDAALRIVRASFRKTVADMARSGLVPRDQSPWRGAF